MTELEIGTSLPKWPKEIDILNSELDFPDFSSRQVGLEQEEVSSFRGLL